MKKVFMFFFDKDEDLFNGIVWFCIGVMIFGLIIAKVAAWWALLFALFDIVLGLVLIVNYNTRIQEQIKTIKEIQDLHRDMIHSLRKITENLDQITSNTDKRIDIQREINAEICNAIDSIASRLDAIGGANEK